MKSLLEIFGLTGQRKSAKIARERLQIVVSHQREDESEDFLPKLRHELLTVISKYVKVDKDQIKVELQKTGSCSILELNITLPPLVKEQDKKTKELEKA
jgi:cell division topological specificity factor